MKDDVQQPPAPDPGPAERDDVRSRQNRCPYCHEGVQPAKSVVCRKCLTRHHASCHQEAGCCSSCGSADVLTQGAAPQSQQLSSFSQLALTVVAGLLLLLGVAPFVVCLLLIVLVDAELGWSLAAYGGWAVVSSMGLFAIHRIQERGTWR